VAVVNRTFVETTLKRLGIKVIVRKVFGNSKSLGLREPPAPYEANFTPKKGLLRLQNTYFWSAIILRTIE